MKKNLVRLLLALVVGSAVIASPVTLPHRKDEDIAKVIPDYFDSKMAPRSYHNATVYDEKTLDGTTLTIIDPESSCGLDLSILWSAHVNSPILSTPVIFPAGLEGRKEVFLSTFYDAVEVLESTGHKPWGWPMMFEDSVFLSSPILYDIDADGKNDVGVIDKNANLFFLRIGDYGQYLEDYHVQVPRLKVARNWFEGLDEDFADNQASISMFDRVSRDRPPVSSKDTEVTATTPDKARLPRPPGGKKDVLSGLKMKVNDHVSVPSNPLPEVTKDPLGGGLKKKVSIAGESETTTAAGRRLTEINGTPEEPSAIDNKADPVESIHAAAGADIDKAADSMDMPDPGIPDTFGIPDFGEGGDRWMDRSGEDNASQDDYAATMSRHYAERYRFREHYADYDGDLRAGDDADMFFYASNINALNESHWINVDAHVLASATLADVNGDGRQELIIPVSYYFDAEEYAGKTNLDFDPKKFIGGGVVCWDLVRQAWAWTAHLDLSTDHTHYKALIKAPPTVVDLDGDGRCEVIVGTDMGMLYVLDGETGFTRRFFPMQFHKIQAQVAVADVVGGDDLEIIVADMAGNLVCVSLDGEVIWDRHLSGTLPFTPTIGDIDGDGYLDIVVVAQTKSGAHLWAVHGHSGKTLDGFPIALPHDSVISAPVLLVDLHDYNDPRFHVQSILSDPRLPPWVRHARSHDASPVPSKAQAGDTSMEDGVGAFLNSSTLGGIGPSYGSTFKDGSRHSQGLHLLVPAHDGHLYIVDTNRGCADTVDLGGEHMSATPLVDDVNGDGKLDILLTTLSGQVVLVGTTVSYHPLNTWDTFPKHRSNGFTHGMMGISIPDSERRSLAHNDVLGTAELPITFDIWDNRAELLTGSVGQRRYTVSFCRGTNKATPILVQTFTQPGRYTVILPMAPPEAVTLVLSMINDHGQMFEDAVAVSVGTRFYIWFKYLVVAPVLMVALPLLLIRSSAPNAP